MAWTNVYSQNYAQTGTSKSAMRPPFVYFFETFLPTVGWTVTDGHSTASGLTNATDTAEDWWACSYTGLDFQGNSYTEHLIYEFEYSTEDINVWSWDGVAGSGAGALLYTDTNYTLYTNDGSRKWNIFTSDAKTDAFVLTINNYIQAMWMGLDCIYDSWNKDGIAWFADTTAGVRLRSSGYVYFGMGGSSFNSSKNLITSLFGMHGSTAGSAFGVNLLPDVLARYTATTTSYLASHGGAGTPTVVQFDGRNYIDYGFGNSQGVMLDIGTNDYSSEIAY